MSDSNATPQASNGTGTPSGATNGAALHGLAPGNAEPQKSPDKAEKPAVEQITLPKDAFDERLSKAGESATRKLLKELGFDKPEDAKEALKTLKSLQDGQKTEKERLEGRIKELEPKATRADVLAKRFEALVASEFDKLPENVRNAIDKVADGDAEKRWEQIDVFRAAGLLGGAPAGQPSSTAPAPKTTAPAGGPAPAPASGGPSKFKEWQDLMAKSPSQAAIFYRLNRLAIDQSRPADG